MVTINQQNATINTQYVADIINFSEVKSGDDLVQHLQQFQAELLKAVEANAMDQAAAEKAKSVTERAIEEARQEKFNSKVLLQHLNTIKDVVGGVKGLAVSIAGAITAVGALF